MHVSHSLHILCARACVWFRLNQTKSFSVNKFVFEVEQSSSINGIVTHFFFRHTIGKPHLPLTFIACLFCMLHLLPVYFFVHVFRCTTDEDKVSNCKTAHFVFLKQNDKLSKRK